MDKKIKIRLFAVFSIITLCVGMTFKYLQNDTFYILKLGEFISKNGIDLKDHYCWIENLVYTYPHWLYDLVLYHIYNLFDFFGVYVSVIVCFILLILCFYYVCLKMIKNEFFSMFLSIILTFRLSMFAVARSQIISLPLFILEVYFINRLISSGKNRYIIYLSIISLVIANVHATVWLFYFILFFPFIGESLVYYFFQNRKVRKLCKLDNIKESKVILRKISYLKRLFIGMIFSFLMGIFTPSKICYTYVFKIMLGNSQNVLAEHLPLIVVSHPFFLCSILVLSIVLIFTKTKIYLREVFMIGGLIAMSLSSTRHLAFFYTIGILYIGIVCVRCLDDIGDNTFNVLGDFIIGNKYILIILLFIIVVFSGVCLNKHLKEEYVLMDQYPIGAVDYIKDNLDYRNMKLYNGYNYGSYLLFCDIPVFIDSRCDLYLKEFNGMKYSIFDDMETIYFKYETKFLKYGVTHVLLNKKSSFSMILLKDINYNVLYEDDDFILFERLRRCND